MKTVEYAQPYRPRTNEQLWACVKNDRVHRLTLRDRGIAVKTLEYAHTYRVFKRERPFRSFKTTESVVRRLRDRGMAVKRLITTTCAVC